MDIQDQIIILVNLTIFTPWAIVSGIAIFSDWEDHLQVTQRDEKLCLILCAVSTAFMCQSLYGYVHDLVLLHVVCAIVVVVLTPWITLIITSKTIVWTTREEPMLKLFRIKERYNK